MIAFNFRAETVAASVRGMKMLEKTRKAKSSEGSRASELPLLRRLSVLRPCTRAPTRGHGRGRHPQRSGSHQGRVRGASTQVALCWLPDHPCQRPRYRSIERLSLYPNLPRLPFGERPYLSTTFQRYDPAGFQALGEEPAWLTGSRIEGGKTSSGVMTHSVKSLRKGEMRHGQPKAWR